MLIQTEDRLIHVATNLLVFNNTYVTDCGRNINLHHIDSWMGSVRGSIVPEQPLTCMACLSQAEP